MANSKIISLGNGGTNILNGIRQHLSQEVATASLSSDNGKIDESDIAPLFSEDLSVVVLITCLGGRGSKITPNVLKTAKGKNIECLCVCIMPFSSEGEGDLPVCRKDFGRHPKRSGYSYRSEK